MAIIEVAHCAQTFLVRACRIARIVCGGIDEAIHGPSGGGWVVAIELPMALVPAGTDLLLANVVPAEWTNDGGVVEAGIPGGGSKAVHILRKSLRRTKGIELPEIVIEGTVLLQHVDDVVDNPGVRVVVVIVVVIVVIVGAAPSSSTTAWEKAEQANAQQ